MAVSRTTIVLRLKQAAMSRALDRGISFAEFVRRALEKGLAGNGARSRRRHDPFWDDRAVFRGEAPRDLSKNHDLYLYGE